MVNEALKKEESIDVSKSGGDSSQEMDLATLGFDVALKNLRDGRKLDGKEDIPEDDEFKYLNDSQNKEYFVYKHTVPDKVKNYTTSYFLRGKIKRHLKLKSTDGVLVTNKTGKEFSSDQRFSEGDTVYLKVPKNLILVSNESDESVDDMRCKGNSYFGIDLSKHNSEINLDEFIKWNREQRDSPDENKRGVSFAYIRVSDNLQNDSKAENHIDKINKYNQNDLVKNNHEQIACGVYHRLSGSDPIKQADVFIKQLEKYSSKNNCLMPMVDIEDGGPGGWISTAKNSGNLDLVRNNTLKWLNHVEKQTGKVPGIYCNYSDYKDLFDGDKRFDKYKTWIAAYTSSRSVDEADMRQYSERGKVGGIPGNVDLNQTNDIQGFMA